MFMANHLIGFGVGNVVKPVTVAYGSFASSTSSLTQYTFSGMTIGTASAARQVVVCVSVQNAGFTVGSMTVGGVSASLIIGATDSNDTNNRVEIWTAPVPTGTTADVVINISGGSANRCSATTLVLYDAASSSSDTASDDATPNAPVINIPANGACVGVSIGNTGAFTWTNLTERSDETFDGNIIVSTAADAFATAQTSLTITADNATNDQVTAVAAWGPV